MRYLPRHLAPIAIVSLLALSACSSEDPAATFDDAGTTTASADAGDTATPEDGESADDADVNADADADADVNFPDPEDTVADATFTVPGTESDKVRFGVESIVVSGRTMELRLVMTPEFDDGGRAASVYDALDRDTQITLIDRENLKEYRVLEADGGGRWYETNAVKTTALPGQSVGYQAFFAAPEDEITAVDVKLASSWPVFEDVPLTFED